MVSVNKFYVYEWFIEETLEVFYVGKGTGNRRFELHNRSKYFQSIYNKYKCHVRLVAQSLTNEESCDLERERIAELKLIGQAKCNFTLGGTGFSEGTLNPIHKRVNSKSYINPFSVMKFEGSKNHFFNKKHSDKTKLKISLSRKGKGARFGKENPMYGKGFKGSDNPMYGKTGEKHHNSKMFLVKYLDGTVEKLHAKACERKFGIAFERIRSTGGTLHYKKKSKNDIYEGTYLTLIEGVTTS